MKKAELFFSLFLLSIAVFVFITSLSFPYKADIGPGPGFLPSWVSGLMIFVTSITLIRSLKLSSDKKLFDRNGFKQLLFFIGVLLISVIFIPFLGILVSLSIFSFIIFLKIDKFTWVRSLSVSISAAIFIFVVFDWWLNVPLPKGFLFD